MFEKLFRVHPLRFLTTLWAAILCLVPSPSSPLHAESPEGPIGPQHVTGSSDSPVEGLIQELGADAFNQRREAFLKLWEIGEEALPAIRKAKSSSELRIAQAAAALEPILLLRGTNSDASAELVELVAEPTPSTLSQLCERGHWDLAEKIIDANESLQFEFQDLAGTWYLNKIAESALQQNKAALAWPIVRAVTRGPTAASDGSDLAVWLAIRQGLIQDQENANADLNALQMLYAGKGDDAMKLPISAPLKRKILTRTARWSEFQNEPAQDLVLEGRSGLTAQAGRAVMFEFSGEFERAEQIWNRLLQPRLRAPVAPDPSQEHSPEYWPHASAEEDAAYRLLQDVPTTEKNQMLLALLIAGHSPAVTKYVQDMNRFALFDLHSSNGDYRAALDLVGLEPDLSNFEQWLDTQRLLLEAEAARPLARGGSQLFEQAAHLCNLLVGLGFKEQAEQYFNVIAAAADTKSDIWDDSILIWMSRTEPRALVLKSLGRQLNKLPSDTRRTILASLFPEFENTVAVLQASMPSLKITAGDSAFNPLQILDRLHSWDHRFFEQFDVTIADWLVGAEREIIANQNIQQPLYVAQMKELAQIARGCGYEELAMQFSMANLESGLNQYSVTPTHRLVAAEILLERGQASDAAELLKEIRSSPNAGNNQRTLILETKALLLSGKYDQALQVDLSRWMRPLSVSRFSRIPNYSMSARELSDHGETSAALEYAELAFQLADFGSMDFYLAAGDLSRIHENHENFTASADALRAPLIEALSPSGSQLDFQMRNYHIHFLRNAVNRERIHRAVACILNERFEEAEHHMRVGQRLQPQDIEMVVACYPRLAEAGRKDTANWLFDTYERTMLKQIENWPNDAMALNNLAWMYSQCDRKLPEALTLAHRAVSLAPSSAIYLDTLAEVHYRSGRVAAAIAAMKDCIQLDPRESHYRENLERYVQGEK